MSNCLCDNWCCLVGLFVFATCFLSFRVRSKHLNIHWNYPDPEETHEP